MELSKGIQIDGSTSDCKQNLKTDHELVNPVKRLKSVVKRIQKVDTDEFDFQSNNSQNLEKMCGQPLPTWLRLTDNYSVLHPSTDKKEEPEWKRTQGLLKLLKSQQIPDSEKYISNYLIHESVNWQPNCLTFVNAPVGTGKTTFAELLIKSGYSLILTNRTANAKALFERLSRKMWGTNFMVATYQSLVESNITPEYLDMTFQYVICDEYHLFLSDSRFARENQRVYELLMKTKICKKIFISATSENMNRYIIRDMVNHQKLSQQELLYRCNFYFKNTSNQKIGTVYGFDNDEVIVDRITKTDAKWMIFINTKSHGEKLRDTLKASGIEVLLLSSEKKGTQDFANLVETEKISEKHQVVISTTVLDSGINLRNVDNMVVYLGFNEQIKQCVGRRRFDESDSSMDIYFYNESKSELDSACSALGFQIGLYKNAYEEVQKEIPDAKFCNLISDPSLAFNPNCETVYFENDYNGIELRFNYLGQYQTCNELKQSTELLNSACPAFEKYKNIIDQLEKNPRFFLINKYGAKELNLNMDDSQIEDAVRMFNVETFLEMVAPFVNEVFKNNSEDAKKRSKEVRIILNDLLMDLFPRDENSRKKKERSFEFLNQHFELFQIPLRFIELEGKKVVVLKRIDYLEV